ncbi:MAG: DUF2871 family protein [Anaerovoracaceae bacterium]
MKKKYIKQAMVYAILAMIAGIFYESYIKAMDFDGVTMLSKAHGHLFLLGMFMCLFVALLAERIPLEKQKSFVWFTRLYHPGVCLTAVMMVVRGVLQVNGTALSSGTNAMISGFAGIGHILIGIGLIFFLTAAYKASEK